MPENIVITSFFRVEGTIRETSRTPDVTVKISASSRFVFSCISFKRVRIVCVRAKVSSVRLERVEMLSMRTFGVRGALFFASYS